MSQSAIVSTFADDLRHALRNMRRNPSFALTAILTLALGIGATTSVFTVVNAVLLKPLPYPDPDRLVRIGASTFARSEALRQAKSFQEAAHFNPNMETITLSGGEGPQPCRCQIPKHLTIKRRR